MLTPREAKEICIHAHKGQWRKQKKEVHLDWEAHKTLGATMHNDQLVNWEEGDTFLVSYPYHIHPIAVAEMVSTPDEKIVAYLHDVFEDCPNWYLKREVDDSRFFIHDMNDMREYDITQEQYLALMLVTKIDGETYEAYMQAITENDIASNVKLADMYHNSSDQPSAKSLKKYSKHIPIMEKAVLNHYE